MEMSSAVVWAGIYDEQLDRLIFAFSDPDMPRRAQLPGPYARSLHFDEHTVETLCSAVIKAEDAVTYLDVIGNKSFQPTSMLTKAEEERMFSSVHSPFCNPLVGLSNIAKDFTRNGMSINQDDLIYRPLKKYWPHMMRRLWDRPARSFGAHKMYETERTLVACIFCQIAAADPSFASVIDGDSDLTISLFTRYWIHATGAAEIGQLTVFFVLLIPRRPSQTSSISGLAPFYIIPEGEPDTTITPLRRILQSNDIITQLIQAIASQVRDHNGPEVIHLVSVLEKYWNWAKMLQQDPLCLEFLKAIRTSAPLWSSLFGAASRSITTVPSTGNTFVHTVHYCVCDLASDLVRARETPSEAEALTNLWVSTGVFDALEATLAEALRCGTNDELVGLCKQLIFIYGGISYGPDSKENPSPAYRSLLRQQFPRPRTIRRLWNISLKLSSSGIKQTAPSHAARVTVMALGEMYAVRNECTRRGCEKKSTARCPRCKLGYCGKDCQVPDWKDHKLVCSIDMTMTAAERTEAFRLTLPNHPAAAGLT